MIIPGSHAAALIILVLGMLGWGLWANTFKAAGEKWRFELFYFDFAIGVLIAATVLALTAGSLGFDGFSFFDDVRLAGKRQEAFAFAAGIIFNLGNMLLLGAVSISGLSVAFPVGMGFALVVAEIWNLATNPGGNTTYLLLGAAVVLGAIVFDILAYRSWSAARLQSEAASAPAPKPTSKKSRKRRTALKSVILALVGGLLLGSFSPLVEMSRRTEAGLGPYSLGFIFAIGILFSTFVFNLFFMNLPVDGEPVDIGEYFRAKVSRHAWGVLGGILWYVGMIAGLLASRAEGSAQIAPGIGFALTQAGVLIAALCGLFLWREWDGAEVSVKTRYALTLVLLAIGIGLSAAGLAPAR